MHFQSRVDQLLSSYIPKFDGIIPKMNKNIDIVLSQKWKVQMLMPLKNIFSAQQDSLLLWYMYKKMVMSATEKMFSQFQVGYMYFPSLKQNNTFENKC